LPKFGGFSIDRFIGSHLVNDRELWQRFRQGEESAYAQIFRAHYLSMVNYGAKFLPDPGAVEDCVQELFLYLWQNRATLGETDHIKPYLLKATRRKVIRQAAQQKRRPLVGLLSAEYAFEVVLSAEQAQVLAEADAEKIAKLQALLQTLPPRQKEILYLLFYQDLGYAEIGQIMSLNYQSARNLVHRALKMLKKAALGLFLGIAGLLAQNFLG
jgi:RNA polymerase sigma factor (sigma-70 family)